MALTQQGRTSTTDAEYVAAHDAGKKIVGSDDY